MTPELSATNAQIWGIIAALGVGTYVIRLSFLGLIGNRELPGWVLRLLRFTPVAVLPGIAAPMVMGVGAEGFDPVRLLAAVITVVIGLKTRNALLAIIAGLVCFFGLALL